MSIQFSTFFEKATAKRPFPFQTEFAVKLPSLVSVPTGLGKTAMALISWLWRRNSGDASCRAQTPRRLVYCLPMRVLVEQTRNSAVEWADRLGLLAGKAEYEERNGTRILRTYTADHGDPSKIAVHVLMGGEEAAEWDCYPERDAILIGTQDMLLSRALNRGYAAGRARWPLQFGLLHTDCLWVFDEIQLMGSGLATTAQLDAFRRMLPAEGAEVAQNGHGCRSVWMSATMRPEWLDTVDFGRFRAAEPSLTFDFAKEANAPGFDPAAKRAIEDRWNASKRLERASATHDDPDSLAAEIAPAHRSGSLTLVVVNTVRRACDLFDHLSRRYGAASAPHRKKGKKGNAAPAPVCAAPRLVLLHSRFRPPDREAKVEQLLAEPPAEGTICISTQVVEAGVDVSATTLFTELASWASLVQRFGRCNRFGKQNDTARVCWIDVPDNEAAPYERDDLTKARGELEAIGRKPEAERNVGLRWLPDVSLEHEHTHVIRRKDLIDLFDTTPDLAGSDIDIDRYVRDADDSDVRVFWRDWEGDRPPDDKAWRRVGRDELCPAPTFGGSGFREVVGKRGKGKAWRWDFLAGEWQSINPELVYPGQVYLVHRSAGGYDPARGWGYDGEVPVFDRVAAQVPTDDDETDDESLTIIGCWQTIAEHTNDVCRVLEGEILPSLGVSAETALAASARWHDWGKAHEVFQAALPDGCPREDLWGKAAGIWKRYSRRHFRHELASALAVLQDTVPLPDGVDRDLVAYLIAAHHGKVRLSIRSLPMERRAPEGKRFARGVWDGDPLPPTPLGGAVDAPPVTLSLEPMEIGLCEREPFVGECSWADRMIRLREDIGPFGLAYLEALLRAADMRASAAAAAGKEAAGA